MSWFMVMLLGGAGLLVGLATVVTVKLQQRPTRTGPACGNCGYNLTGSPSNRCPECGMLFIEAGILKPEPNPPPARRTAYIVLALFLGLLMFAGVGLAYVRASQRASAARALAMQQARLAQAQARIAEARAKAINAPNATAATSQESNGALETSEDLGLSEDGE